MDEEKIKSEIETLISQHKEIAAELNMAQQKVEILKTNAIKIEGIIEYLRRQKTE